MELAIFEPTIISETGRDGMDPMGFESTAEEASMNEGGASSASPTSSPNVSMIHSDEEGPHPGILNEDILEIIFKRIINQTSSSRDALKDVRNIRLVCKVWKNVVTLLYRRTQAPIKFETHVVKYSLLAMKTFVEVMQSSELIPVQGFEFRNDFFQEDTDQELLKDFLLTCGSDTVSLHLHFTELHIKEFDLTRIADLKMGKLKKLGFEFTNIDDKDNQTHGLVPFLGLLLDSAKALEEFAFDFRSSFPRKSGNLILMKQFERIICRELSKTVKILNLSNVLLDETSFNTLTMNGLKLEEFQFNAFCFPGNELSIRKFLENQTNTMKALIIEGRYIGESSEFEFPRLNELLGLDMTYIPLKPFSLAKTFPSLRMLNVQTWDGTALVELLSFEKTAPTVNEIIMPTTSSNWHIRLAKTVSEHFPNISVLSISPDSDVVDVTGMLQEVFIHFRNIEQLNISMYLGKYFVLNADSLFSGMCEDACKRIKREPNFDYVDLEEEQSMPSILNLTKLKKLEVDHGPGRGRFILTDIAAHFVFLRMSNLKELSLSGARISPRYIERLENKLNLEVAGDYGYSLYSGDDYSEVSDAEDSG